jgi:hypothetical protein
MEELDLGGDLTYSERPIKILDTVERVIIIRLLRCARFNGVTTPRMKLPGSMKKSSEQIFLNDSHTLPNLEGEIPLRGVGL